MKKCPLTKFDVTGYFLSPASGHFVNYFFFKFLGSISLERLDINAPNVNRLLCSKSSTPLPNFMLLAHSFRLYNAKRSLSPNLRNALKPNFEC